jgi:hypothetical protein
VTLVAKNGQHNDLCVSPPGSGKRRRTRKATTGRRIRQVYICPILQEETTRTNGTWTHPLQNTVPASLRVAVESLDLLLKSKTGLKEGNVN